MRVSLLLFGLVAISCASAQTIVGGPRPATGYVPDAATAVRIAEAVLRPIYGRELRRQLPLRATLAQDSVWVVGQARGGKGGAYVEISRATGRILRLERGK